MTVKFLKIFIILTALTAICSCCMGRIYMPGKVTEADITRPAIRLPLSSGSVEVPTQAWLEPRVLGVFTYEIVALDFACDSTGKLYIIFSTPYAVYFAVSDESTAVEPEKFYSGSSQSVAVCLGRDDTVHVFWAGIDNRLCHRYRSAGSTVWELEQDMEIYKTSSIKCVADNNDRLHLTYNVYVKPLISGALSPQKWYSKLFYVSSSSDSFSKPVYQIVKEGPFSSIALSMDCDSSGAIHMSWLDLREEGEPELYYKKKTGAVWDRDTKIANTLEGRIKQHTVTGGAGNDCAHILWATDRSIFYRESVNGDWSDTYIIGDTYYNGNLPYIAACVDSKGTLHAFWMESGRIMYRGKVAGGWTPECIIAKAVSMEDHIIGIFAKAFRNETRLVWLEKTPLGEIKIVYKKGWAN